jgi:diguanylate cyclase (GGDEF)-like protein
LCAAACGYALGGAARGAILSLMILVLLGGMFRLSLRQAIWLALAAFAMLGAVVAGRAYGGGGDPTTAGELRLDAIHLAVAAIVVAATLALPVRLGRMRAELSSHRAELRRALELNRALGARDSLTGLLSRRAVFDLLRSEQPRPADRSEPMALAMVDIDCFRRVNDTFGHETGDQVLKRFAELARVELRSSDALARWGGEEFLLLMPGSRREQARTVLDRLSVRMAEGGFGDLANGLHLSFSAGIAECRDDEPYATAIERADRALFRAKKSGRNRIESV